MIKHSLLLITILGLAASLSLHTHDQTACASCPADQEAVGGFCYASVPVGTQDLDLIVVKTAQLNGKTKEALARSTITAEVLAIIGDMETPPMTQEQ